MIFAYALYVPAGIALTSAYAAQLMAGSLHWAVPGWVLFLVILGAVVLVAYLGISTSSAVDLLLVPGEVAVISALAITVLVKAGPAHYSAAVFSPASSPHGQFTDITQAMIYGITAFAGFEAATPFLAFGWLGLGAIAAGFLRARRPGGFAALDRVFAAGDTGELKSPSGG